MRSIAVKLIAVAHDEHYMCLRPFFSVLGPGLIYVHWHWLSTAHVQSTNAMNTLETGM